MSIEIYLPHFSERTDLVVALPGGRRVAAVTSEGLALVDPEEPSRPLALAELDEIDEVVQLCADREGRIYALTSDGTMRWDAELRSGELLEVGDEAHRMSVRGDGRELAFILLDDNLVQVVDADTEEVVAEYEGPDSTHRVHVLLHAEDDSLWWLGYGGLQVARGGGISEVPLAGVEAVSALAAADGELLLADFESGRVLRLDAEGSVSETVRSFDMPVYALAAQGDRFAVALTPGEDDPTAAPRLVCGRKIFTLDHPPEAGMCLTSRHIVAPIDGEVRAWRV